jgi:hypothetical protein
MIGAFLSVGRESIEACLYQAFCERYIIDDCMQIIVQDIDCIWIWDCGDGLRDVHNQSKLFIKAESSYKRYET